MNKKNNYIWIFGENLGNTANNNSFWFWKYAINQNKNKINKYMVLTRNKNNIKVYNSLSKKEKKGIIWRNSLKHKILYKNSDLLFVTLSYKDVVPNVYVKDKKEIGKPIVYLQHGILGIKKIDYTGKSYNNNIIRFIYYNSKIKDVLVNQNDFRRYQLYNGVFQPRYIELVRRHLEYTEERKNNKKIEQITWFITWRENFENNMQTKLFIKKIRKILTNSKLNDYLNKNNIKFNVVLHQFFMTENEDLAIKVCSPNISIENQRNIDIMQTIVETDLLITDYSSIGFDVTLLGKPVILYFPDIEDYIENREIYCTVDELKSNGFTNSNKLIEYIIGGDYKINDFYKSRLPEKIDFEYIKQGKHIDRMYKYFTKLQKNKITFLGYNFYGVGGTVSATRSLAEGLLENGYMVELLSLKKTVEPKRLPYGLSMKCLYNSNENNLKNRIKRSKIWSEKNFKYLENDPSKEYLVPYVGYAITKKLQNIRSNVVISTRESLHQFLIEATSDKIQKKIYFYHCPANVLEEWFPGVVEEMKKYEIDKAVFVTEKNREEIEKIYGYNQYKKYLILGNTLERKNCININRIESVEEKEVYRGIYLLRVSKERISDLNNLINFGEYVKQHNIKNIIIDVYGDGDYVESFLDILEDKDLIDIIIYKGKTNNPTHHIRYHDVLLDFSENHSFGMTYIEGVMNGKMVFCMKNPGSLEVMKDIPEVFIESNEDLVRKINNLPNISKEKLQENYRKIWERYSRKELSNKFIDFLNE